MKDEIFEISLNPAAGPAPQELTREGKNLLRKIPEENRSLNIFKKYYFEIAKGMYIQKEEGRSSDFLKAGLAEIRELGDVYYTDAFKNISIKSSGKVSARVRVNTGTGLLEMKMQYKEIAPKELLDLLNSYKLKKDITG